jgi:hypothetical protein
MRPPRHARTCRAGAGALRQDQTNFSPSVTGTGAAKRGTVGRGVDSQKLKGKAPTVPGYRLRIVDGNHLPVSDKRLEPLRSFRGAALPRQSLVMKH